MPNPRPSPGRATRSRPSSTRPPSRSATRPCKVSVLRLAPLFGPGVRNFYTRVFDHRVVPVLMGYDPLVQLLHPEDALAALEAALERSPGGAFNVVPRGSLTLVTGSPPRRQDPRAGAAPPGLCGLRPAVGHGRGSGPGRLRGLRALPLRRGWGEGRARAGVPGAAQQPRRAHGLPRVPLPVARRTPVLPRPFHEERPRWCPSRPAGALRPRSGRPASAEAAEPRESVGPSTAEGELREITRCGERPGRAPGAGDRSWPWRACSRRAATGLRWPSLARLWKAIYFSWHSEETDEYGYDPQFAETVRPLLRVPLLGLVAGRGGGSRERARRRAPGSWWPITRECCPTTAR